LISAGLFCRQSIGASGVPSTTTLPTTGRPRPPTVTEAVPPGGTSTGSCQHGMCDWLPPTNSVTTTRETLPGPGTTLSKTNRPSPSARVSPP
jgi:hypothetical protein